MYFWGERNDGAARREEAVLRRGIERALKPKIDFMSIQNWCERIFVHKVRVETPPYETGRNSWRRLKGPPHLSLSRVHRFWHLSGLGIPGSSIACSRTRKLRLRYPSAMSRTSFRPRLLVDCKVAAFYRRRSAVDARFASITAYLSRMARVTRLAHFGRLSWCP
jgi:hypothetical protein